MDNGRPLLASSFLGIPQAWPQLGRSVFLRTVIGQMCVLSGLLNHYARQAA